jgi:adenosylhomocysteine nucleosidase
MANESKTGAEKPSPIPRAIARKNPRRCDLAVVMSSSLESGCFEDRLSCPLTVRGDGFLIRQGALQGRPVAIAIAGPKPRQATRAAEALAFGHSPRLLVAAGFASGLSDRLHRGDLVVADSILGVTRELLQLNRTVDRNLLSGTPRLHVGRLLTFEHPVDRPAEKRSLGTEHAALAADGQSLVVAKVCRGENIPFLAVRVVLDAVDDELPPEIRRLTSRKTAAQRIGAVAGSLVRRPSSIKDLWNVYETSLAASQTLATFLEAVVASMM